MHTQLESESRPREATGSELQARAVVYPKLGKYDFGVLRVTGPGLGNLLYPWARAIAAAARHRLPCLFPTWPQIKLGSILRREHDTRYYFGLFQRPPHYVGGFERLALLARARREPEARLDKVLVASCSSRTKTLIVFEGMDNLFEPILRDHRLVAAELIQMTRPTHRSALHHGGSPSISVHVRLGDFDVAKSPDILTAGQWNCRIPITWYVEQVQSLRRAVGPVPVHVFSDGRDEELRELLALHSVTRADFGSSVADLLALSRATILVASGSTFSMWASYLGRMPVVWHPGQLRQRLYHERPEAEIETSDGAFSGEFLREVTTRLAAAPHGRS